MNPSESGPYRTLSEGPTPQVKLFCGMYGEVERRVNEWLIENKPTMKVESISHAVGPYTDKVDVLIHYTLK